MSDKGMPITAGYNPPDAGERNRGMTGNKLKVVTRADVEAMRKKRKSPGETLYPTKTSAPEAADPKTMSTHGPQG